jgi:predicted dinucleotide-binding enzyme
MSVDPAPAAPARPIAILGGTGPAGTGLALRWARAQESIIIGSRDAQRARDVAAMIRGKVGFGARDRKSVV